MAITIVYVINILIKVLATVSVCLVIIDKLIKIVVNISRNSLLFVNKFWNNTNISIKQPPSS